MRANVAHPGMTHPALSILKVWAVCIALYVVLPFKVVDRSLHAEGFLLLFLFLAAFCIGSVVIAPPRNAVPRQRPAAASRRLDFSTAEMILATAGLVTVVAMLLDIRGKSVFDLAESYDLRSDQATALMEGAASASSAWFQIAFLTYPAAYVYLVRTIIFEARPNLFRLAAFGFLPVLLATVSMGGRAPVLYAILISFFAFSTRKVFMHHQNPVPLGRLRRRPNRANWKAFGAGAIVLGAMYYFIAVFFTRAEVVGGAAGMFKVAEEIWGIGFSGPTATFMFQLLGDELMYIIFIFSWYIVQGLVMGNFLFSDYQGPMQLGVYGVDLVSALVRRLDGGLVARNFDALQQLGVYGFLPSAFGSLYVDLWYFGLLVSLLWGALAGLVYQRVRAARDPRWLLFAPFVTMGILFSFINTPIGFSNGLVTHLWMLIAFLGSRRQKPARFAAPLIGVSA